MNQETPLANNDRLLAEAWAERDRALDERDAARADLDVTAEQRDALGAELAGTAEELVHTRELRDAVMAERDQARADLARAVEERERMREALETRRALLGKRGDVFGDEVLRLHLEVGRLGVECDRLRAVLAMSYEDLVDLVTKAGLGHLIGADCKAFLAALRARAGMDVCSTCGRTEVGPSVCSNPFHRARAGEPMPAVAVTCTTCHLPKAPRGRDIAPAAAGGMCTWQCPGYDQEPRAGDRWPGEEPTT